MLRLIKKALELRKQLGIRTAAGYLRNQGVGVDVAQAVLVRNRQAYERMIAIARALQ
jgi:hypothetical protein